MVRVHTLFLSAVTKLKGDQQVAKRLTDFLLNILEHTWSANLDDHFQLCWKYSLTYFSGESESNYVQCHTWCIFRQSWASFTRYMYKSFVLSVRIMFTILFQSF